MFIRTENFKEFIRFYPIVTIIIAIQLVIWLSVLIIPPLGNLIFQWGAGVNLLINQGEYWRLVTPIFLHDPNGIMHVLFNSFSLVLFGPALEQMLGKTKFIFTYFLTGIIGNFFTYFTNPEAYYVHVGASGAIYGLFGVYMFMVFFRKHLIDRGNAQIITTILIIGLVMTFLRPGINILGHLFGFIGGVALGPLILNNVKPFSVWKNRRPSNSDSVQFDPNRWNKKRLPIRKYFKPALWVIIVVLVLLGLVSRFF
ncbi:rhomboid family intramembrane serine protease [Aquibacillus halophilus]|uniref:Rhomboid family intramembrane serine protease n=1 Tax=Aquibacillus halophilus TaxID=930132 RepID=A0A6A8DEF4_9BACI|nr:rhomboid family intramembrane serine protease [Aquibacillus halophilus]MRH43630.1 rhomboid family intramembrane serine protease [Aquibacillus halophilus]